MRLPHADAAVVPLEKITSYLLNDAHPEGRGKAAFFHRVGFRPEEPHVLQSALLRLAVNAEMIELQTAFGLKYVGSGELSCPDGRRPRVVTVWMLRAGLPPPHFVTAFPE
jgi:hypothetical protein